MDISVTRYCWESLFSGNSKETCIWYLGGGAMCPPTLPKTRTLPHHSPKIVKWVYWFDGKALKSIGQTKPKIREPCLYKIKINCLLNGNVAFIFIVKLSNRRDNSMCSTSSQAGRGTRVLWYLRVHMRLGTHLDKRGLVLKLRICSIRLTGTREFIKGGTRVLKSWTPSSSNVHLADEPLINTLWNQSGEIFF